MVDRLLLNFHFNGLFILMSVNSKQREYIFFPLYFPPFMFCIQEMSQRWDQNTCVGMEELPYTYTLIKDQV